MKEDYLITIQGTMEQNGGSDSVQRRRASESV